MSHFPRRLGSKTPTVHLPLSIWYRQNERTGPTARPARPFPHPRCENPRPRGAPEPRPTPARCPPDVCDARRDHARVSVRETRSVPHRQNPTIPRRGRFPPVRQPPPRPPRLTIFQTPPQYLPARPWNRRGRRCRQTQGFPCHLSTASPHPPRQARCPTSRQAPRPVLFSTSSFPSPLSPIYQGATHMRTDI